MARALKMCPRTKFINLIYHWFLERIKSRQIKIYPISTEDQVADIFTKPLPVKTFVKHRKHMLHW